MTTHILVKPGIIKVNWIRPRVAVPDVFCADVEPSWEDSLLFETQVNKDKIKC